MEANITISIERNETTPCPGCGKTHLIDLNDVCLSLGTCSECQSEIIVIPESIEMGSRQ
jgi:hypothetical protein